MSDSSNTETNPILELIRSSIGQTATEYHPPFNKWLGGTLQDITLDKVVVEHTVRQDMTNSAGMLHGGVISSIFDDTFGTLSNAQGKEFLMVSINLYVDFIGPARTGDVITTTGYTVRSGKRLINIEGDMMTADGNLIAKAKINFMTSSVKMKI